MLRGVRQMIGVPQSGADRSATAWESRKSKLFYGFTVVRSHKYHSVVVNRILLFSELETTQIFKTKKQVQIDTGIVVAG